MEAKKHFFSKKTLIIILTIIGLTIISVGIIRSLYGENENVELLDLVPNDAEVVFQINNLNELSDNLLYKCDYWNEATQAGAFPMFNHFIRVTDSLKFIDQDLKNICELPMIVGLYDNNQFIFILEANSKDSKNLKKILSAYEAIQLSNNKKDNSFVFNQTTLHYIRKGKYLVISEKSMLDKINKNNGISLNENFQKVYATRGKNAELNMLFPNKLVNEPGIQGAWTCWDISFNHDNIHANGCTNNSNSIEAFDLHDIKLINQFCQTSDNTTWASNAIINYTTNELLQSESGKYFNSFLEKFYGNEIVISDKYVLISLKQNSIEMNAQFYGLAKFDDIEVLTTSLKIPNWFKFNLNYMTLIGQTIVFAQTEDDLIHFNTDKNNAYANILPYLQEESNFAEFITLSENSKFKHSDMMVLLRQFDIMATQTEVLNTDLLYQYAFLMKNNHNSRKDEEKVEIKEDVKDIVEEEKNNDTPISQNNNQDIYSSKLLSDSIICRIKTENTNTKIFCVTNHRNGETEYLKQDSKNVVSLVDKKGNTLWKAQLSGRILGDVVQIDFYKNRKLQYVFNTSDKVFILDRNGNNVERSPYKISGGTQCSMSVFDYENDKNYRFVLVKKDGKIVMTDKENNIIKGWNSSVKQKSTRPVQYVHYNGKDYIVAGNDKDLFLLDRKGNIRVTKKDAIVPSSNPIYQNKGSIIFTNKDVNIFSWAFDGTISAHNLSDNWNSSHSFVYSAKYQLYILSDNEKTIVYNQEFNPLLARNISYKIYLDGKYLCLYNNKDQSFEIFDMSKGLEAVK